MTKKTAQNYTLEIEREAIDVTSISEPDPNWQKVCECDWVHGYRIEHGKVASDNPLPSLTWVVDSEAVPEAGLPEWGHYECMNCGEEISPGTRPGRKRSVPGQITVKINGERVTRNEFIAFFKKQGRTEKELKEIWPA